MGRQSTCTCLRGALKTALNEELTEEFATIMIDCTGLQHRHHCTSRACLTSITPKTGNNKIILVTLIYCLNENEVDTGWAIPYADFDFLTNSG